MKGRKTLRSVNGAQLTWRKTFFLLCSMGALVAVFAFAGGASAMRETASSAPSIISDQEVYSPGQSVRLSGSGWQAGESVRLFVNDNVGNTWNWSHDVTADGEGTIVDSLVLPNSFVATYTATATGASSGTASTTFFDDNIIIVGPASANVGDTKSYTSSKQGNGCNTTSGTWSIQAGSASATIVSQTQTSASIKFNAAGTVTLVDTWNGTTNGGNPCNATGTLPIVVSSSDTTPPVITITTDAGDTVAGTGWYNIATSGTDGVKVNVSASDPSGVASLSCSDGASSVLSKTYSPAGSPKNESFTLLDETHNISCTATDGLGNGPGAGSGSTSMPVSYKVDQTAPSISGSAAPSPNGAGWNNTNVTVSFTCSDATSTISTCTSPITLSSDGAGQSASGSAADKAGNTASTTVSGINIDKTAPTIHFDGASPGPNGNGWNNSDVTLGWSCTDGGSGEVDASVEKVISSEGENQSATGMCSDKAGNEASSTDGDVNIDKTAPTISASRTPAANGNGWNNTDVTVHFSCGDPVSGGTASGVDTCPADVTLTGEGANQSVTRTVYDKAGNFASATKGDINIDKTAPNLGIADTNAVEYNVCGARPTKPGFSPSDALSGLDGSEGETWTTPGTPNGVGTYTYSAHAQDKAGNPASYGPKYYTVLYGAAVAQVPFLQPINADGSSRFKVGSTIPVKFQALCNGAPVGNLVAKMYVKKGDSQPDPGVDEAISTAASTTGNLFRFTGSPDNQYIFNLSTKLGYVNPSPESAITSFSQGTWTLKIGLDDGTFRSVNVQLVK
jgi:hypothetical protein